MQREAGLPQRTPELDTRAHRFSAGQPARLARQTGCGRAGTEQVEGVGAGSEEAGWIVCFKRVARLAPGGGTRHCTPGKFSGGHVWRLSGIEIAACYSCVMPQAEIEF